MSALLADINATCAALCSDDGISFHMNPDALQGLKVNFNLNPLLYLRR